MQKIRQSQRRLIIAGGSGAGWVVPMLVEFLHGIKVRQPDDVMSELPSMRIVLATREIATSQWFEETPHELLSGSDLGALPPSIDIEVYHTGDKANVDALDKSGPILQQLVKPGQVLERIDDLGENTLVSETSSGHATEVGIKNFDGRPDLLALVASETASAPADGPLGVFVCGPLSMQSNVSNTIAIAQLEILKGSSKQIYLHMEHFSWA